MMFRPLTLTVMLALGGVAQAQGFHYRGQLEDGGLPAEGRYDLKLSLFAAPGDKLPLIAPLELSGVEVRDGRFEAPLDFAGLPGGIEQGWLEVAVRAPGDGGWWTLEGRSAVALKAQFCPESWALSGNASTNPGVNFLGTLDAQPLVLGVANARVVRYEPAGSDGSGFRTANVIAGSSVNTVAADIRGATIAGGGSNGDALVAGATGNLVSGHFGTVGGGVSNTAGGLTSTVAGGERNAATGTRASVLGGFSSTASGGSSAVLGGSENCAGASHSVAAGFRAKVRPGSSAGDVGAGCAGVPAGAGSEGDQGTFVWADVSSADPFVSSAPNQFLVRAFNGMVIAGSNTANEPLGNRLRVNGFLRVDALPVNTGLELCWDSNSRIASCGASSLRYKEAVRDLPLGLDAALALRPVSYRLKDAGAEAFGFVAEEVAAIDPRLVTFNAEGEVEGVRYSRLSTVLVNALRELRQEKDEAVARLESENAILRTELAALSARQAGELAALRAELALLRELIAPAVAAGGR